MATLTNISGTLYNAKGEAVTQGKLSLTLQQDMVSVDGTKVAPFTIAVDLSQTAGLIDINLYATVGASPAGLAYFAEFDPDPSDLTKRPQAKDGYWSNYWAVPNVGSVPLGNFVDALRGQPSNNYMPLNGVIGSFADVVTLGQTPVASMKRIRANQATVTKPEIRFNPTTAKWEFSNDGTTFSEFGTGGGASTGDITSIVAGSFLTGGGTAGDVTINIATGQDDPSWLVGLAWSKIRSVPVATAAVSGVVKVDGTSITANAGVISSILAQRSATDSFYLGSGEADTTKTLFANVLGASKPAIRFNQVTRQWEYSNDGTTFTAIAAGGGGGTGGAQLNIANTWTALQSFQANMAIGANAAQSGGLRLANNVAARIRNAANSSDLDAFVLDGTNILKFGSASAPSVLRSNLTRPSTTVDKDVWFELTGESPTRKVALMVNIEGTAHEIASITIP